MCRAALLFLRMHLRRQATNLHVGCRFPRPLGLFPTTVDNRLVRVVAILRCFVILAAVVLAIVAGIREDSYRVAAWLAVGLTVEFSLGTFGGSSTCPLGALAAVRGALSALPAAVCCISL